MHDGKLFARAIDVDTISALRPLALLVGSFDGSRNYGDFLQFYSICEIYRKLSPGNKIIAVVEIEYLELIDVDRIHALLPNVMLIYFSTRSDAPDHLQEMSRLSFGCLHFYGGGYINDSWGERKRAMANLLRGLNDRTIASVVFTGVQISRGEEAYRWKEWISAAEFVGVRDHDSVKVVREYIGAQLPAENVMFTADDALPELWKRVSGKSASPGRNFAIHVNLADYSAGDQPDLRIHRIVDFIAPRLNEAGRCDFLIAYPSSRIDEDGAAHRLRDLLIERLPPDHSVEFCFRNLWSEALSGKQLVFD